MSLMSDQENVCNQVSEMTGVMVMETWRKQPMVSRLFMMLLLEGIHSNKFLTFS
jgi:hypothetical protein